MTPARWQAMWDWPLTTGAVTFLVVYSWQVVGDLQGRQGEIAQVILTFTWVIFCIDYIGRLLLAKHRWSWFVHHLLDLAIVVLPMLRPLRLIRLLVLLNIFQRFAGKSLRGRVVVYAACSTLLLVFVAALAVLDAERQEAGAVIATFGDALWWACTTITTVGYGDLVPESLTGRLIAIALMVGGIALLGTVTATLASWIVQRVTAEDDANQAETRSRVEALTERLHERITTPLPQPSRRRRSPTVVPRRAGYTIAGTGHRRRVDATGRRMADTRPC